MDWSTFVPDLIGSTLAGVVAAFIIAGYLHFQGKQKRDHQAALINIMGRAIQHRNIGQQRQFSDAKEWVKQAKALEDTAVATAKKLSPAAGAYVEWLDRVPPYDPSDEVAKYVSFLSTVIERIREIIQRNI